ncbi:RNA polymerase sigma factor [Nonomuraea typhae]|uniref:RNA polymerase sigma factor n=1 Tax=Nonomuraea typhae TaxID=2603600 RepID=UPI0012FC4F3F|nr:sigma-70 family RNA polymerase sigma factor [Nonomuraea typhae]
MDLEAYYKSEFKPLVRFVMRSIGTTDVHEARDAVQSAFTQAHSRWDTIKNPDAWLRTVALREFLRRRPPPPTDQLPVPAGPDSTADAVECRRQERLVRATLQSLPPRQRAVMAWYLDGFKPGEIATQLGQDPAAVRQNLHKARSNLRKAMNATTEEAS